MNNLTPAQQRQQSNRTADGKYTTKTHSEADVDLGLGSGADHDVIELEDAGVHAIDLDAASQNMEDNMYFGSDHDPQDVLESAIIHREGDAYYVTGVARRDFHDAIPHDYANTDDPAQLDDYLAKRQHVIDQQVADWYGYDLGDSITTTTDGAYEFTHELDGGATTEAGALEALRDNTKAMDFSTDEDLAEAIQEALHRHDATKLPNPEHTDERVRKDFANEFATNMLNRLQEQAEDEGFTDDDGKPLKLRYADDTKQQIKFLASTFYQDNEGDLNAYGLTKGINATVGMTTEDLDYDEGLADRAYDLEREVLARRMERSIDNELPKLSLTSGYTEISSDDQGYGKVQLNQRVVRDIQERQAAARDELRIAKG